MQVRRTMSLHEIVMVLLSDCRLQRSVALAATLKVAELVDLARPSITSAIVSLLDLYVLFLGHAGGHFNDRQRNRAAALDSRGHEHYIMRKYEISFL